VDANQTFDQLIEMQEENKKLQEEIKKLNEKIKDLETTRFNAFNPWKGTCKDSSKSSSSQSKRPKSEKLKKFKNKCDHKCQLTGHECKDKLTAAHVYPLHNAHLLKSEFGGKFTANQHANLLCLHKDVEVAFDKNRLCFVCLRVEGSTECILVMKILDRSIADEDITETGTTFGHWEDQPLDVSRHCASYTLLGHHTRHAIIHAFEEKWIDSVKKETLLELAEFWSPANEKVKAITEWLAGTGLPPSSSSVYFARQPCSCLLCKTTTHLCADAEKQNQGLS
jgi:hypothetical protein